MRIRMCLSVCATMALALPVYADISYDQHITVDAAGVMSMAASEGDIVTQLSADKARTDSNITMKSRLTSMFAGSGKTGTIVRLDKALSWNLLPDKQEYSELTFAEARAQMDEARKSMEQAQASGQGSALPVSAEGCQWTEGKVHVEHPAGTEVIAGLSTEKHIIKMEQSCTDPTTSKACDITWLMETSLAQDVPGEQEARAFHQAYAEAMGLGEVMRQAQGPAQGLLAMFASNWKDVVGEFEKLQGYPMRTVMQMSIGGEQCTTASGQPIATDQLWTEAGSAAGESLGQSVAGSIGGAAVGAAAGQLIGGLSGMFGKDASKPAQPAPQPSAANGQVTVFRIATEVTRWSAAPIAPSQFEEPVGWKKL